MIGVTCDLCGRPVAKDYYRYCGDCFRKQINDGTWQPYVDPDAWTHPLYGRFYEGPTLLDVIVKMHQRCSAGNAPSLKKVDAVRLLDFFDYIQPGDSDLNSPSPGFADRTEAR